MLCLLLNTNSFLLLFLHNEVMLLCHCYLKSFQMLQPPEVSFYQELLLIFFVFCRFCRFFFFLSFFDFFWFFNLFDFYLVITFQNFNLFKICWELAMCIYNCEQSTVNFCNCSPLACFCF